MGRRVLVVDDELAMNTLATEYLRLAGFEAVQCYDGESALKLLASDAAFDLILLDRRMPGMDGLQTCREIKKDARLSAIPIVMLSASTAPAEVQSDFAAYVTKPFSPKALVSVIKKLLP